MPLRDKRQDNTLQHTATPCNTLQQLKSSPKVPHACLPVFTHPAAAARADATATQLRTLQHTATYCNILQQR
eukprot:CAMPEP_0173078884 /NCGR_PEP_ID=MMETSP1102-20130122/14588_1 /TAXON_ID=49646 /ORGANISM="Geminigera sp., Strain Caron Lab Isolate" /LENGTH=71 /DNA_ID=CAMNT_0013950649 /DNA_START=30 /DNA_END=242 /DNA_ORIENTATION=-